MSVLENPELQRAMSKVISGSETEWKEIHRFMVIDGQMVTWYPELPVQAILAEKNALLGSLYGITLSRMIGYSLSVWLNVTPNMHTRKAMAYKRATLMCSLPIKPSGNLLRTLI